MKKMRFLPFALSGVLVLTAMCGLTVNAEEQLTADTTTATEETTQAVKQIIVAELTSSDQWTGGEFSKTVELGSFGYEFGAFSSLMLNDSAIDSSCYTVSQNGNESVTFTLSEAYMSTLAKDTNYFTVDFENVTIQNGFAVTVTEAVEDTTAASEVQQTEAAPVVGAPKTGDIGVSSLFALLAVSGITAVVLKKKK